MTIDERARRLDELEAAALATRGIRFLLATTSPDAYALPNTIVYFLGGGRRRSFLFF